MDLDGKNTKEKGQLLPARGGFLSNARARLVRRLNQFHRDEKGAMIIFGLICFIAMLVGAGMAVDFMRYENQRTRMQNTLDRALLASAALTQPLDAQDVVYDYFNKSGLKDYTLNVTVDQGLNFRTVSATASAQVNSLFLNIVGIDTLMATARGTAEERIQNVEVSLILDVSGSMGSYSRIDNLKVAAQEFVQSMLESSDAGKVSISIIPYNATVNVGQRLIQEYTVSDEHTYSNCIRFPDSDFRSTSISTVDELERLGHFNYSSSSSTSPIDNPWCGTGESRAILPFSTSEADLDARIQSLYASGNTAADLGMKWGVALLDPGTQGVVTNLIATNDIDAELSGRPVAYNNGDTLKIIVLMTDGENTTQYDVKQARKDGVANVWQDTAAGPGDPKYSVWDEDRGQYFLPHNDSWSDYPIGGEFTTTTTTECYWKKKKRKWRWVCDDVETNVYVGDGTAARMTYPQLWNAFNMRYAGSYLWDYDSNLENNIRYSYESIVNGSQADDRLLDICSAAKNAGITVFTIGFEAPSHGSNIMEQCASSSAHFYDVNGMEIAEAFSAIVATIQKLKLVQ